MDIPAVPGRWEDLALQGRGMSPGTACGPLVRNDNALPREQVRGGILVAGRAAEDDLGRILEAAATITVGGAVLSHVSLLSQEFGKPSVCFLPGSPVHLVTGRDDALLGWDQPEDAGRGVIDAGDVVLVDGERGSVRVPGGRDVAARQRVRDLFDAVVTFARDPDDAAALDRIRGGTGDPLDGAIAFVLEAGIMVRLVPEGGPARRLLAALVETTARRSAAEPRLDLLRARILGAEAGRRSRAAATFRVAAHPSDVERAVAALEKSHRRAAALLFDLGFDPAPLQADLEPVLAMANERSATLRSRIRIELDAMVGATRAELEIHAPRAWQLLRRARDAGIEASAARGLEARLEAMAPAPGVDPAANLVVPLEATGGWSRALVGGKAAGLFETRALLPAGCAFPAGFVITTAAYHRHLHGELEASLRRLHAAEADPAAIARQARAAILAHPLPADVSAAVAGAAAGLLDARLAVRSSATVEDGAGGSFAGLFETWLGIVGLPELLGRLRDAWSSLWNPRALRMMERGGLSPLEAGLAVIVQRAVETVAAGVLVSRDPVRGPDTLLVNAAWGLGEGISQGVVPGDLFWVRRSTGERLAWERGVTARQVVLDNAATGTLEVDLPEERATRPCLGPDALRRLAALARALDASGRAIREVEFGFGPDGTLYVFQVRPAVRRAEAT